MKSLLVALFCASAVPAVAQDAATLNQSLQLQFNRYQAEQGQALSSTSASYNFNLGLPVLQYGLGALNLTGTETFERVPVGGGYASAAGLNQYGANLALFPYLPFQLNASYGHSQNLDLAGQGSVEARTIGLGIFYNGPILNNLRLSYGETVNTMGNLAETYTQWKADTSQHFGSTGVVFSATRQNYSDSTGQLDMTTTFINLRSDTRFSAAWLMRTRLESLETTGMPQNLNLGADLVGTRGAWSSMTAISADRTGGDVSSQWTSSLSQSLARSFGHLSIYGTVSESSTTDPAMPGYGRSGGASLGETWRLARNWSLNADVSGTWGLGSTAPGTGLDTRSYHVGIAENGDIPDLIQHALFFASDRGFNRRVVENYPPGFIPGDLAAEFLQRRVARQGTLTYTVDFSRTEPGSGPGRLDRISTAGNLGIASGIQILMMGDWSRDDGISIPGVRSVDKDLSLSGSWRLGEASLSLSGGVNSTATYQGSDPAAQTPSFIANASSHWSAGIMSQLLGCPSGAILTAYEDNRGQRTRAIATFTNVTFGKVTLRLNVTEGYTAGGPRTSQISFSLVRWFDTIALRAPWNR